MANKKKKSTKRNNKNVLTGKRFSKSDKIQCPTCCSEYTVQEWDDFTYERCKNREDRKDFRSLSLNISKRRGEHNMQFFYHCPNCKTWVEGYNLHKVVNDDSTDKEAERQCDKKSQTQCC